MHDLVGASKSGLPLNSNWTYHSSSEENRQPFIIGDMLYLSGHDFTRLLKKFFVIPFGIQQVQCFSDTIVFANPYNVHGRQGCQSKRGTGR